LTIDSSKYLGRRDRSRTPLAHLGNRIFKAIFYSQESNSRATCAGGTARFLAGAACGYVALSPLLGERVRVKSGEGKL
jgi:hypothetical protein